MAGMSMVPLAMREVILCHAAAPPIAFTYLSRIWSALGVAAAADVAGFWSVLAGACANAAKFNAALATVTANIFFQFVFILETFLRENDSRGDRVEESKLRASQRSHNTSSNCITLEGNKHYTKSRETDIILTCQLLPQNAPGLSLQYYFCSSCACWESFITASADRFRLCRALPTIPALRPIYSRSFRWMLR